MNRSIPRLPTFTWPRLMMVTLAMLCCHGTTVRAESPDATAYRRVFVPAHAPDSWPTGAKRYLPVASDQFETLLSQARAKKARAATSARLRRAAYHAELIDDTLLAGTVEYAIESPSGEPRVAPLEPMNLAILAAHWQGEVAKPVKLGLWSREASRQIWGVLTPRSGSLRVDWQLRSQSTEGGPLEFVMRLPPAAPQTLELSLPVEYRADLSSAELPRTDAESGGKRRWLFQLASQGPHHLQLFRESAAATAPTQLRLSQATEYRLEPDGLQVRSIFRCEPQRSSTSELRCSLSGNLKVCVGNVRGRANRLAIG